MLVLNSLSGSPQLGYFTHLKMTVLREVLCLTSPYLCNTFFHITSGIISYFNCIA